MTTATAERPELRINHTTSTHDIALDSIEIPASITRLKEFDSKEDLAALAQSMAEAGLLQPIGVVSNGGKHYRLVWGRNRLTAAKQLGWQTIPCVVVPGGYDVDKGQSDENQFRRPMNPLEEAVTCEHFMRLLGGDVALVAARMGKQPTWVRDRLYLSRLCPKARAMVVKGEMPLAFARELAKVVDPRTQEELLDWWYGSCNDNLDIECVRRDVNGKAMSLHQVPWLLGAKGVAKGKPVCTECEHNSDNARKALLFEHDDPKKLAKELGDGRQSCLSSEKRGSGPYCLNAGCYDAKQKAAAAALKEGAAAAKKSKGKKPAERLDAAADAVPSWVEPKALAKAIDEKPASKATSTYGSGQEFDSAAYNKRMRERNAKRREKEKAAEARNKDVLASLKKIRGGLAGVWFLLSMKRETSGSFYGDLTDYSARNRDKAKVTRPLQLAVSAIASGKLTIEDLDDMVRAEFEGKDAGEPWTDLHERMGKAARELFDDSLVPPRAYKSISETAPAKEKKPKLKPGRNVIVSKSDAAAGNAKVKKGGRR